MVHWVFRGLGAILESKGRLYFVIGQKDIQVLYHIQEVLGFGKVTCTQIKSTEDL